jgi:glycogen phosphorylase
MLLGIGGIRALKKLGIDADIYHCNEGHSAFIGIERFSLIMDEHRLAFYRSQRSGARFNVFTTHTPVPAGHDSFHHDLFNITWIDFPMRLGSTGRIRNAWKGEFCRE